MRIEAVIEALRNAQPMQFVWGAGCSCLYSGHTLPGDRSLWDELKKYDSNRLLHEIKAHFFHKTKGIEDVPGCLLKLNACERSEVLKPQATWADFCVAELMRVGRVARILTANFDGGMVAATAKLGLMPPLYRHHHPSLKDAATPSIYLLGDAPPGRLGELLRGGAPAGPWIVIGCSGKHFGLAEALRSVDRFEQGLYWVSHFHAAPPDELGPDFFTVERNTHWISGFDADCFMAYLLRGLAEFPPRAALEQATAGTSGPSCGPSYGPARTDANQVAPMRGWLAALEKLSLPAAGEQVQLAEVAKYGPHEFRALVDKTLYRYDLGVRMRKSAASLGRTSCHLASVRAPREVKPLLIKAWEYMQADAQGDVMCGFSDVCCQLAAYCSGEAADEWYARADAIFAQMDFGPYCGAPVPYGNYPKWAGMLAEWGTFERRDSLAAIFDRAKAKYLEVIRLWEEVQAEREARRQLQPPPPEGLEALYMAAQMATQRLGALESARTRAVKGLIEAVHGRARVAQASEARRILTEVRPWLEELRSQEADYTQYLARQLFREAEAGPEYEKSLVQEGDEQFRILLKIMPDEAATIYCNWGVALSELAMARSGDDALAYYSEAARRFQETEAANPDLPSLHKNWSSALLREARARGGSAEVLEKARQRAERAESVEEGSGAYNLACHAAETGDDAGVVRWLEYSAQRGKIARLSHILEDPSFARYQAMEWFRELLNRIFALT